MRVNYQHNESDYYKFLKKYKIVILIYKKVLIIIIYGGTLYKYY